MYLLFDIGGTRTRIAKTENLESFERPLIIPTPSNFNEAMRQYGQIHDTFAKNDSVKTAFIGVAGPLDKTHSTLTNAPNLPDWIHKPLKEELQKIVKAPVFLENDAALAGLGEAMYGAGKAGQIVAYITIGTGVGGARIVDKKIDRNILGFEPGHQILDAQHNKTLEDSISGRALQRKYGQKGEDIKDPNVWEEAARILAIGIHNSIVHWSPSMIVIGGAVSKSISLERVRDELKKIMKIFPDIPRVEAAELGDAGTLYGAMKFLKDVHPPTYQESSLPR